MQARRGDGWALDVTLKAPRRVYLRAAGWTSSSRWTLHVTGTTGASESSAAPPTSCAGDYDFAGKRFEFDPRERGLPLDPAEQVRLDLIATREDPSLTASVRIKGTAAKPDITLTSTPSLPNDEVLSQVLFGRSASQLSPLEAAQLASALSSLAGGGGFDVRRAKPAQPSPGLTALAAGRRRRFRG
jgi:translocation and assembly module TamB